MPDKPPAPPAPPPMPPGSMTDPKQAAYDFIWSEPPKKKRSLLSGGNSKQQRVLIVVIIFSVLLLFGIILAVIFSQSANQNTADLIKIAKQQQELTRISEVANIKARGAQAKNMGAILLHTMRSDQTSNLAYLKDHGTKVSEKELQASKSAQTDELLTQAEQTNQFDEVFLKTASQQLTTYQRSVKAVHDSATSRQLKILLEKMFFNAGILLKDPSLQSNTGV
jgi:hypothetical protein